MSGDYINIHVLSQTPAQVCQAVTDLFSELGWQTAGDERAAVAVEDEDKLPEGDGWYGVLVSGGIRNGWVSVYVDDWQDSGVLARGLSRVLASPVLEVWVAQDTHWGYTYFEDGQVCDRFADDPQKVAETPAEAAQLAGGSASLTAILRVPSAELESKLRQAQASAGQFVGTPIDDLAQAVGLPFEHLLIGYESFFEDDPEDYAPGLENWDQWRHLAFRHPQGKELLAE